MAFSYREPKTGKSNNGGWISPDGVFYPLVHNSFHGRWILDNYEWLKYVKNVDLPAKEELMNEFQTRGNDFIRDILVSQGWIHVYNDRFYSVRSIKEFEQKLIDYILQQHFNSGAIISIYDLNADKIYDFKFREIQENGLMAKSKNMNIKFSFRKIFSFKIDLKYLQFELQSMIEEKRHEDLFDRLQLFFILNVLAHDETIEKSARQIISEQMYGFAMEIKDEIKRHLENWHNQHTSPENLLGFGEEFDNDPETTLAYIFIEQGFHKWTKVEKDSEGRGHIVDEIIIDIRPYVGRFLSRLGFSRQDISWMKEDPNEAWENILSEDQKEKLVKLMAPYIFKEWKKFWGKELIKPTRDALKAIQMLDSASIKDLPSKISISLNIMHVSGYQFEHMDLTSDQMTELSNIPEGEINYVKNKLLQEDFEEENAENEKIYAQ